MKTDPKKKHPTPPETTPPREGDFAEEVPPKPKYTPEKEGGEKPARST